MAEEEKSEKVADEVVEAAAEETSPETAAPEAAAESAGAPAEEEAAPAKEKKSGKPRTAEDIFLDTASTVRGVRAGARQMASPRESDEVTPPAPATDHGSRKVDEFDLPLDDEAPDADAGADEPTYTEA